jgi:hypothetical protein
MAVCELSAICLDIVFLVLENVCEYLSCKIPTVDVFGDIGVVQNNSFAAGRLCVFW